MAYEQVADGPSTLTVLLSYKHYPRCYVSATHFTALPRSSTSNQASLAKERSVDFAIETNEVSSVVLPPRIVVQHNRPRPLKPVTAEAKTAPPKRKSDPRDNAENDVLAWAGDKSIYDNIFQSLKADGHWFDSLYSLRTLRVVRSFFQIHKDRSTRAAKGNDLYISIDIQDVEWWIRKGPSLGVKVTWTAGQGNNEKGGNKKAQLEHFVDSIVQGNITATDYQSWAEEYGMKPWSGQTVTEIVQLARALQGMTVGSSILLDPRYIRQALTKIRGDLQASLVPSNSTKQKPCATSAADDVLDKGALQVHKPAPSTNLQSASLKDDKIFSDLRSTKHKNTQDQPRSLKYFNTPSAERTSNDPVYERQSTSSCRTATSPPVQVTDVPKNFMLSTQNGKLTYTKVEKTDGNCTNPSITQHELKRKNNREQDRQFAKEQDTHSYHRSRSATTNPEEEESNHQVQLNEQLNAFPYYEGGPTVQHLKEAPKTTQETSIVSAFTRKPTAPQLIPGDSEKVLGKRKDEGISQTPSQESAEPDQPPRKKKKVYTSADSRALVFQLRVKLLGLDRK